MIMTNLFILMTLSILPVLLILSYIYIKDKHKEPISLLLIFFSCGVLSCFLVLKASELITPFFPFMQKTSLERSFLDTILYAFLGVAFIEEICKWIMVYFIGYHHSEFDEIYDMIVYSVFVSLGFAFFENVSYVLINGNLKTVLLRAISAIPGHACDAIFMGYYLSIAKVFRKKKRKDLEISNITLSIMIPTVLHGIYDYCLLSGYPILVYLFGIFVISLYMASYKKLRKMSKINKKIR